MKKNSRNGGKFNNKHGTLTETALIVADIANRCEAVTKISIGFIKAGLPSNNGQRRVKILDDGAEILLSVRDNSANQELHIYATDKQAAKLAIARASRNAGLHISFGSRETHG